jgi:hypothetical protein
MRFLVEQTAMKKFLAVVLKMTMNAMAMITFSCKRMVRYWSALPFRVVIGLTVLSLIDCVALGQTVLSGSAVLSGGSQLGYPTGAPLTYSARTDNCVTGSESGCVAQGGIGQPLTFLIRASDSPPFAGEHRRHRPRLPQLSDHGDRPDHER